METPAVPNAIPTNEVTGPRTAPVGACPACGSPTSDEMFILPDRLHSTPGSFGYRRCRRCRTVFQDPRVVAADLELCYPDDYLPHAPPPASAGGVRRMSGVRDTVRDVIQARVRREPVAPRWRLAAPVLAASRRLREQAFYSLLDELHPRDGRGRRALDVGCGAGRLMAELGRAGWAIDGVEWDVVAAATAARTTGRPVWTGDFREVELPREAYDLILLNHVFEHLADPRRALARIAQLLRPGGRAVLVYPNPDSLGARLFREYWFPWDPPRHLIFPSPAAVAALAASPDWSSVRVRTTARSAPYMFNNSRAYRAGRSTDWSEPSRGDRALALWEGILVAVGLPRGEEIVCTLRKAAPATPAHG
jgi:SAM-dependent methyltransferase